METGSYKDIYAQFVQLCKINELDSNAVVKSAGISRQLINTWEKEDPKTVQLLHKLYSKLDEQAKEKRIAYSENNELFAGALIRTFSGIYVNVFDPKPDMFIAEDIAEGLAYNYRWRGHTRSKITVAEHCVRVYLICKHLGLQIGLAALFHDASEAYLGDLASPIKRLMPEYVRIEKLVMRAIGRRFGFNWVLADAVKQADRSELYREWYELVLGEGPVMQPEEAKAAFMDCYYEVIGRSAA